MAMNGQPAPWTIEKVLGSVLSAVVTVGSLPAIWQYFGWTITAFIVAAALLAGWLLFLSTLRDRADVSWWERGIGYLLPVVAIGLMVVAAVLFTFKQFRITIGRPKISDFKDHLAFDRCEDATRILKIPDSPDLVNSFEARENDACRKWIAWTAKGAVSNREQGKHRFQTIPVYIECEKLDQTYDDFEFNLRLQDGAKIVDALGFLMHNAGRDIWCRPSWREVRVYVGDGKANVFGTIQDPQNNDKLVLFVRLENDELHDPPPNIGRSFPDKLVEVH